MNIAVSSIIDRKLWQVIKYSYAIRTGCGVIKKIPLGPPIPACVKELGHQWHKYSTTNDYLKAKSLLIRSYHQAWIKIAPDMQFSPALDNWLSPPWVAIQASRCAGRVDRILAVKNPGVSLRPSYENGGRVVPPGTIAVLLQDILGEKGSLPIRYPDLIRPMYWVSFVGI